jgi:hypothetical protein
MSKLIRSKNSRNLYITIVEIFYLKGLLGNISLLYIDIYRTSLLLSSNLVIVVKRGSNKTLIPLFLCYSLIIGVSEVNPYILYTTNNSI